MVWIPQLQRRDGILYFDGCNTEDLVKEYGTPLYVYSETRIRNNYRRLLNAFRKHYSPYEIYYAVKANNHPAILNILLQEGAGVDCSCPAEVRIANNKERTLYTGAYVSEEDFLFCLKAGICLNLDSIEMLKKIPSDLIPEKIGFRINPLISASGKESLKFAGIDAKFGILPHQIPKAYQQAKDLGIKTFGAHIMVGSNILNPIFFERMVRELMDLIGPLKIPFDYIDIGGSLGIPYHPDEKEIDLESVAKKVTDIFKLKLSEYEMGNPRLIQEPGRYLVGDAGILLSTVTSIKEGRKRFVGVDAGMNTLIRPALYGSYHHPVPCKEGTKNISTKLVGPICENRDQFHENVLLPESLEEGNALALLTAGAYGFSMSSQYNTRPRAAEVLVKDGEARLIRQRETFESLFIGTHIF